MVSPGAYVQVMLARVRQNFASCAVKLFSEVGDEVEWDVVSVLVGPQVLHHQALDQGKTKEI